MVQNLPVSGHLLGQIRKGRRRLGKKIVNGPVPALTTKKFLQMGRGPLDAPRPATEIEHQIRNPRRKMPTPADQFQFRHRNASA